MIELLLQLLRRDVFPVGQNDQVFDASFKIQIALPIHPAEIAGMEPAVPEALRGGLRVFVISGRNALAPDADLPLEDLYLAAGQRQADGADDVPPRSVHRHDGRTLRDPVALQDLDPQRLEKAHQLRVQRSAPADDGFQPPAEHGAQLAEELFATVEPDALQGRVQA